MPDIFDQVAKQQQATSPASSTPPSSGNDIFSQVAAEQKAAPPTSKVDKLNSFLSSQTPQGDVPQDSGQYSNQSVVERMKGGVKRFGKDITNLANVTAVGIPKRVAPEVFNKIDAATAPSNPKQEEGSQATGVVEALAPIPGLGKLEAAKTAGAGVKAGYAALKGAIDTGVHAAAESGDVGEAGKAAAIGAAGGALTELLPPISKILKNSARDTYARVLHPQGRALKEVVESKLLSGEDNDLVGRGVYGFTKKGLVDKIDQHIDVVGKKLDDEWSKLPQNLKISVVPIVKNMSDWIEKKSVLPNGELGRKQIYKKGMDLMHEFVNNVAPKSLDTHPENLRAFRQMLDDELFDKSVKVEGKSAAFRVKEALAGHIREEINKTFPDIGAVNQEISFWSSAKDMLQKAVRNDVGKTEGGEGVGSILKKATGAVAVGAGLGYAKGRDTDSALAGGAAAASLALAMRSTAWRTVSPVMKDRIAEFLASGRGRQAAELANRALGWSMVRTTKPYSSYANDTPPSGKGIPPSADNRQSGAGSSPTPP